MGSGASLLEERRLFDELVNLSDQDLGLDEVLRVVTLFVWKQNLRKQVLDCDLLDVEGVIEASFARGKTPLVLDTSDDERFVTYLSYQPEFVLFNAKEMISVDLNQSRIAALELGRRHLVAAMQTGKTLVVRIGTAVPDFAGALNDDGIDFDTTGKRSAYFPLDLFKSGGSLLRDPTLDQRMDAGLLLNSPYNKTPTQECLLVGGNEDVDAGDVAKNEFPEQQLSSPPKGGSVTWSERLFRDADMLPHRNFAICRSTFRVLVISSLSADQAVEFLWKQSGTQGLADPEWFQVINIVPDQEVDEAAAKQEQAPKDEEQQVED